MQAEGAGGPPGRSAPARDAALRASLWLLLGGWLALWALFAAVVAPTAFRVLPSTELAGRLVGPVLASLHLYGAVAGLLLAAVTAALHRGPLRTSLPLLMAGTCLVSHFGVTAGIAEVRDLAFGAGGSEEAAARFAALHRLSVALFGTVGLLALALAGLHARTETRRAGDRQGRRP